MFYSISYIHVVMGIYFSNSGPVGFVIDIMNFGNFDTINKSDPLSKYLQPIFFSSLDSWQNTGLAFS